MLLAASVGVIVIGLVVVLSTRPGAPSCGKYALTQGASTVLDGGVSVSPSGDAADLRFDSAALAEAAVADAANAQVLAAVHAMPPGLRTVGAVITFERCGESATPVLLSVPAPDPKLDAYAWDGDHWAWLGGSTDRVVAALPDLPQIVAWVESLPTAPIIGTEPDPATGGLAPEYAGVITELYAPGLTVVANGTLSGQAPAAPAPGAPYVVYPVIGNLADGQVDTAVLQAMLGSEPARKAHADTLVKLAMGTNFAGVAIDYRGLAAQWRDPYAALIEELAEALHASGRQLVVVVPEPLAAGVTSYDTQGYDWARIGRAADAVQVEMPIDVAAYHAGGQAVAFLKWAGTQVNRGQIQPILSAASLEQAAPYRAISFADAVRGLAPSGVTATISTTAGTPLLFSLNPSGTLTYDASTGAYNYPFATSAGVVRRSVHTAATLSAKLSALAGLRLRGAMVRSVQGKQAAPGLAGPIKAYRQQAVSSGSGDLSVDWSVQAADGSRAAGESRALSQSNWTWTPNREGIFNVSAAVASVKLDIARVTVGKGGTPADVAGGTIVTGTADGDCPNAAYVAD
ncbi:MAG TPA: hypothetical protein VJ754_00320, partial [Anaerolineae bacterium]|nr:hypothetical protein [Anaerolineae bacterium]